MHVRPDSPRELLKRFGSVAAGLLAWNAGLPARAQAAAQAVAQAPAEQLTVLCTGPARSIPDIVARRVAEQSNAQRRFVLWWTTSPARPARSQ